MWMDVHARERSRVGAPGSALHAARARTAALLLSLGLLCPCWNGCDEGVDPLVGDAPVLLLEREVQTLDPRFVTDPVSLRITRLLHAGLMRVDPGRLDVVPDLAENWRWEGPRNLRVTLRAGLHFSDGTPLGARDVAATFDGLVDPALGSRYAVTYRRIVRVEVLDERTVRFVLRTPHAPLLADLEIPILPARFSRTPLGSTADEVVGAGPYRLVGSRRGALRLQANPHWWGPPPKWSELAAVTVRDAASRVLRFRAGAADLAVGNVPPVLLPALSGRSDLRVRAAPGARTLYVGLRMDRAPLDDRRVREALLLALDRERLVRGKLGGRGRVAAGWVPPGHWAADPALVPVPFDPERAGRLLDAAGLPDPDGAGPEPRLRLALRVAARRELLSVARALAAMWRRIGVEVRVRPSEPASLFADLQTGRFQMALMRSPEVLEPHVLSWFFGSDRVPGVRGRGGANRWRLRSVRLDAALERGRSTVSRPLRVAAYRQVQRILARELPVLPLWHEDVVVVASARARWFRAPRDGRFAPLVW